MKKKHWVVGIIIIGIIIIGIIIISIVLCQDSWKKDKKTTGNNETIISDEKTENETEFVPSYNEEEDVLEKTEESDSTNVQDETNINKNETLVPSDMEGTNDSDETDKVDDTKNEEEQEPGSGDESADNSNKELPFVPFD